MRLTHDISKSNMRVTLLPRMQSTLTLRAMNKRHGNTAEEEAAFKKAVGTVVRGLRKSAKMTQAAFAEGLGVDASTVTKVETGVHLLRMETWLKAGLLLDVPVHEIFRWATVQSQLGGKMSKTIEALEQPELELIRLYRLAKPEGQKLIDNAAATFAGLHPKDSRVVPLKAKKTRAQ